MNPLCEFQGFTKLSILIITYLLPGAQEEYFLGGAKSLFYIFFLFRCDFFPPVAFPFLYVQINFNGFKKVTSKKDPLLIFIASV